MSDSTYAKIVAEARELGAILPCHWTAQQRLRVLEITSFSESYVDEMIACSRMMNGSDLPGPLI